ncbi:MAG: hypothetical protein ACRYGC_07515 [Janthinobacterium lividum]
MARLRSGTGFGTGSGGGRGSGRGAAPQSRPPHRADGFAAGPPLLTSAADAPRWRRFLRVLGFATVAMAALLYGAIVTIDPWNALPGAPVLPRVPVTTNARFTFPALARSQNFDSVVLGTSTSRLLRPAVLDATLGGRFANLAMNSATAWEQVRLLEVFARTHPRAATVLVGLDDSWCRLGDAIERNARPFPDWMYEPSRWPGYGRMFNLYAVQESASELWTMLGLKKRRYGLNGYTNFLPPETAYDPARVDAAFAAWGYPPTDPAPTPAPPQRTIALLAPALRLLPPTTRKLLFFTPDSLEQQGLAGTVTAQKWTDCKQTVVRDVAAIPNVTVADFMIPSPITRDRANYWDPIHYRVPVADQLMRDLADAEHGRTNDDDVLLAP